MTDEKLIKWSNFKTGFNYEKKTPKPTFFIYFFLKGKAPAQKSKKAPKPAPVEESSEEESDDDDDDDVEVSFDGKEHFNMFLLKKILSMHIC